MATKINGNSFQRNKVKHINKLRKKNETLHLINFDPKASHAKGSVELQYRQFLGRRRPHDGLYSEHLRIYDQFTAQNNILPVGSSGIRRLLIFCGQVPVDTITKKENALEYNDIIRETPVIVSKREQKRRNKYQQKVQDAKGKQNRAMKEQEEADRL